MIFYIFPILQYVLSLFLSSDFYVEHGIRASLNQFCWCYRCCPQLFFCHPAFALSSSARFCHCPDAACPYQSSSCSMCRPCSVEDHLVSHHWPYYAHYPYSIIVICHSYYQCHFLALFFLLLFRLPVFALYIFEAVLL